MRFGEMFRSAMVVVIFISGQALACGVEGSAKRTDGSKVDGLDRIKRRR